MEGLAWRVLLTPEYAMTFLEGFLLAALPALGFGNAVEGGGVVDLKTLPSLQMLLAAGALGVLNGIRSLRNLRSPAPATGRDRRAQTPTP